MRTGAARPRLLVLVVLGAALLALRFWPAPAGAPAEGLHDFNPQPETTAGWDGGNLGGGNYAP